MSTPLPSARRTRFRDHIEEGLSGRAAAARFDSNMEAAALTRLIRAVEAA